MIRRLSILFLAGCVVGTATGEVAAQVSAPEHDAFERPIPQRGPVSPLPPWDECSFGQATAGGGALVCLAGGIRNIVDAEGGTYVPGRPSLLNFNISAGSAVHRGAVVINPDNGRIFIVKDGYDNMLFSQASRRHGGIHFYGPVTFHRGLKVCSERGGRCLDAHRYLARGLGARLPGRRGG